MPIVSITKASKLSGKSVRTIHRHLANGRLSYVMTNNGKGIDVSELIRSYGAIMTDMSDTDKNQMAGHDNTKNQTKDKMQNSNDMQWQYQIKLLKLELEAEKRLSNERLQIIEAKQETIDNLKTALKLLEYRHEKIEVIQPKEAQTISEPLKNTLLTSIEPITSSTGFWNGFKKIFK